MSIHFLYILWTFSCEFCHRNSQCASMVGAIDLGCWNRSLNLVSIITIVMCWKYSTGWWVQPLWKILVSWDDYSQYMEKYKMFQTTNQLYMFSHTLLASHQITTKTCSEFRSIIPQWFNDGQFTPGFPINFPLVYQYHSFPYSYFDGHHHMGLMILHNPHRYTLW